MGGSEGSGGFGIVKLLSAKIFRSFSPTVKGFKHVDMFKTCDISQFHMCNYSFVSIFVWGESRTGAGTCSYGPGHTSSSQQVPQSSWFCDILKHGVIENCIL